MPYFSMIFLSKFYRRIFQFVLGFSVVLGLSFPLSAQESYDVNQFLPLLPAETAKALSNCIPDLLNTPQQHLLGMAQEQGISYYRIQVNLKTALTQALSASEGGLVPPELRPWTIVAQLDTGSNCQVILAKNAPQPASWLELFPESVARAFALQDLQFQSRLFQALRQDPLAVFQQRLDELEQLKEPLFADQAWAFEQLGLVIPRGIQILTPAQGSLHHDF